MTGPYESVIGCEKEAIIERSVKGIMTPFRVVEDEGQLCATLLHFDGNKCTNIWKNQNWSAGKVQVKQEKASSHFVKNTV